MAETIFALSTVGAAFALGDLAVAAFPVAVELIRDFFVMGMGLILAFRLNLNFRATPYSSANGVPKFGKTLKFYGCG
jgi:hypothetical protein